MKLTQAEIAILDNLRQQYIAMMVNRNLQNSATFASNVHALQTAEAILKPFVDIYLRYTCPARDSVSNYSSFHFLTELRIKFIEQKIEGLYKEMRSYLHDHEGVMEVAKCELAKEPRIINIESRFDVDKRTVNSRSGLYVVSNRDNFISNEITFSDGEVLRIKSFNDKKELAKAKKFFDAKMESLSNGRKLVA